MQFRYLLITLFLLLHFGSGLANENCLKGSLRTDMCAEAEKIATNIASQLPVRMSQKMTWESVIAVKTTVQSVIRYSYNRHFIESAYERANIPMSEAKRLVQKNARNVCRQDSLEAFVNLGGTFKTVYMFRDGDIFTTTIVDNCH